MVPPPHIAKTTNAGEYEALKTAYDDLRTTNELLQDAEREICRLMTVKMWWFPDQSGPQYSSQQYKRKGFGFRDLFESRWWDWASENGLLESVDNVDRRLEKANASKMELTGIQDALRCGINELSRPSLRSLSILDLPDEILLQIFEMVEDPTPYLPSLCYFGPGRQDIKSARLVCRRFCHVSSELLVRLVRVSFNEPSLVRLEEISRHPTIAKGVRAIRVVLHFYNFSFTDFDWFISYYADEVEEQANMFHRVHGLVNVPEQTASDMIAQARAVTSTLRRLTSTDSVDHGEHLEDGEYRVRLNDIHRQYLLLLDKQESLIKSGRFSRAVSSAIAMMPGTRKLEFRDADFEFTKERALMIPGSDIWGPLYRSMLQPTTGYHVRTYGLEPPSYQCISDTVGAIRSAGVLLSSVDINLSVPGYPGSLVPAPDIRQLFSSGMQQLEEFAFECADNANEEETDEINNFLSACLDSPSLQTLSLGLGDSETEVAKMNLGHIMGSKPRYKLTDITLRQVAMDLAELVLFLKLLPQPMSRIFLSDFRLLSGTWREALDALQKKKPRIVHLREPQGAECDDMPREDYERIFGNGMSIEESEAEFYIRDPILLSHNPLQTLDEGSDTAD
ncbi:hypothetical protein MMYC01_205528 [Madurella mycetomatis]|uniref:Uncharacterized protein n=1 Tax=Madurella mycetomatis TaxID=100816 RepID=A0A175VZL2_9PEZI|nr:hypothetical protein MMYC01_207896 [Madurella mycetomatis]KXX78054.1 hypothetical protein MMYC01_205528 [Madurella mycetomatis]